MRSLIFCGGPLRISDDGEDAVVASFAATSPATGEEHEPEHLAAGPAFRSAVENRAAVSSWSSPATGEDYHSSSSPPPERAGKARPRWRERSRLARNFRFGSASP